jgi:ATP-dependent Clp protease ATP-binding subunit ClpA
MAVIVMTTNLGASDPRPAGFSSSPAETADQAGAIRGFFRPSSSAGSTRASRSGRSRLPRSSRSSSSSSTSCAAAPASPARNLRLEVTPGARARRAQLGHDPKLGARPLRRTIEDLVVVPIAERMARDPSWRDATVRMGAAPEPADISV